MIFSPLPAGSIFQEIKHFFVLHVGPSGAGSSYGPEERRNFQDDRPSRDIGRGFALSEALDSSPHLTLSDTDNPFDPILRQPPVGILENELPVFEYGPPSSLYSQDFPDHLVGATPFVIIPVYLNGQVPVDHSDHGQV
jgi:hypothetical protein